jgi:hypothetical protein
MSRYAIFVFILLLVGCASSGVVITKSNNVINMPHYSIEAPPDQGWRLNVVDNANSNIYLRKSINSTASQMWFNINWVAGEHMKTWTAKQVADDYRNSELSDMQISGVMTGMFELKDVIMGEDVVDDKKFYTMDYVQISVDSTQISSLYLYFPKDIDIGVFIVAIHTDGYTGKEMLTRSYKPEFIRVLESLQVIDDTPPR